MKGLIKMTKKLYGYAVKENVIYQWSSESGACEVCKEMDGKLFESADEIPDRPHPNCKCHIEILEKESDEINKDPIEAHREKLKERKRNELELAKLLGDTKSLEEEIEEYIKQVNKQEKEINKFEDVIDINKLESKDRQKLKEVKEQINSAKYKAVKTKGEVFNLKIEIVEISHTDNILNILDKLYYRFQILKRQTEEYIANDADKWLIDVLGFIFSKWQNLPDAFELYKIASPNLDFSTQNYIEKNGKLYEKISDLNSEQLEKDIHSRLKKETGKTDCKVLLLDNESSISKSVLSSYDFKSFIKENINDIRKNGTIPNKNITFKDGDLYNALHGAMVKDVKFDSDGNLIMRIEDLYNFEPKRTSIRGRTGERLQNIGKLENFYIIILIKIPKEELIKFEL